MTRFEQYQAFFDKTIRHFIEQGVPSRMPDSDIRCRYRGPNKTTCAIGCHIPDALYNEIMDHGYGVHRLLANWPELNAYVPNISLAGELQMAHDRIENWKDWQKMVQNLHNVAREFDLSTAVLDSLDFSHIKSGE